MQVDVNKLNERVVEKQSELIMRLDDKIRLQDELITSLENQNNARESIIANLKGQIEILKHMNNALMMKSDEKGIMN